MKNPKLDAECHCPSPTPGPEVKCDTVWALPAVQMDMKNFRELNTHTGIIRHCGECGGVVR